MIIDRGISAKVTDEDIAKGIKDGFGVLYSHDGKRLLRVEDRFNNKRLRGDYHIMPGTQVVCDNAFGYYRGLINITIPDSVTHIGELAFASCHELSCIRVNENNRVYDSRENCNLAHMNVINYELNNIAWAKIFRQMKLFGESARARDFSKSLVDHMLSPVDLLQYDHSSFVKEVTKAFED